MGFVVVKGKDLNNQPSKRQPYIQVWGIYIVEAPLRMLLVVVD